MKQHNTGLWWKRVRGDFHLQLASPHHSPRSPAITCWTLSGVSPQYLSGEAKQEKKERDVSLRGKRWEVTWDIEIGARHHGGGRQVTGDKRRQKTESRNVRRTVARPSGDVIGKWRAGIGGKGEGGKKSERERIKGFFRPHAPQLCKLKVSAASRIPPKKGDIYRRLAVAVNGPLLCHTH